MYQINALDQFDVTDYAGDVFQLKDTTTPDAVLVRSSQVPDDLISHRLLLVARSGIGTNTINIPACTANGTAVFNTPGANANAVKELVVQCLFRYVRPLYPAIKNTTTLTADNLQDAAEATRKDYIGEELYGKTVGILGLGAIGQRLANTCYHIGMQVVGYNRSFKNLQHVQQLETVDEVLEQSDFVIILLPLTDETKGMLSTDQFRLMKDTAILMNFGRGEIVDNQAVINALEEGQFSRYITDFPHNDFKDNPNVVMMPHLGGNTVEALSHSANLTLQNTLDFLESGTIRSSVNFPPADLPFTSPHRVTFFFKARQDFWADVAHILNKHEIPVRELMSNFRDDYGYTIVNIDLTEIHKEIGELKEIHDQLMHLDGMIRIRLLKNPSERVESAEMEHGTAL
ncbi:NAD(P)-dependent oxidoreductase [Secundilactobacillus similis]|uniref:Phosphoglycerate dehydrogenase n=1 Tax=Secundilactobacillus similis DSM 23365 = JCM 2765 TaxID=1423804 RepID=A0A0R2FMU0_9LACO|nr:NAD(P)-dependent oxidoreductase [Secundilactobacillus similis]KRN25805.1 phosphoglycerate dehydrogenase [Secundilactobacillus similis DSM 23365 = JCM 2765]